MNPIQIEKMLNDENIFLNQVGVVIIYVEHYFITYYVKKFRRV